MHATICGRRYRIRFTPLRNWLGHCTRPDKPSKTITIAFGARRDSQEYLEVVLHEALHAACWALDEELVNGYARDAARLAHRLGFRHVPDAT